MRKGLQVKDLVMTGAFAALYFLCVGLGVLVGLIFDRSGNMFYAPAGAAIFGGTVYMLLQSKIKKFGAISLLGIVMGGFFFLLAKQGNYQNKWLSLASFVLFSFANSGPIIMMWLARETYVQSLLARGKTQEYIDRVMVPVNPQVVLGFVIMVVIAAIIGGLFGQYLVKKHFIKSGMVSLN